MHAVVPRDAEEIAPHAVVCPLPALDERLVLRGWVGGRIEVCRHDAEHAVSHAVEEVVVGDVARSEQADAGLVETALQELPDEGRRLTGRNEHVEALRCSIPYP